MKIRSFHILLAIIIIIGRGILLASQFDLYNTTRVKSPRKTLEGGYDIDDMRGSHTLEEIEKYFQVPASAVIEAFGLKADTNPSLFKLKDLGAIYKPVKLEGKNIMWKTMPLEFLSPFIQKALMSPMKPFIYRKGP